MYTNSSRGRLSEIFFTRKILYLSDVADLNVPSLNLDERLIWGVLNELFQGCARFAEIGHFYVNSKKLGV